MVNNLLYFSLKITYKFGKVCKNQILTFNLVYCKMNEKYVEY